MAIMGNMNAMFKWLLAPVRPEGLAVFRIAFEAIILWDAWLLIEKAWVERHFTNYVFHFTYWPFDFVKPLPGDGMYVVLLLMGAAGLMVALGFAYRLTAPALALVVTYIFLIEQADYLNHWYLVCLLAFVLAVTPAHRTYSVDAWLAKTPAANRFVPRWSWCLLLFQLAVPMSYGGIAKLNADWLRGEPLRLWLTGKTDFPLIGPFFELEAAVYLMAYGALALDLFFVAYMGWKRTRVFGFALLLVFHIMNDRLWTIGIFPWMMIAATPAFFGPDWPRRVWADLRGGHTRRLSMAMVGGLAGAGLAAVVPYEVVTVKVLVGCLGGMLVGYFLDEPFGRSRRAGPLAGAQLGGPKPEAPWRLALLSSCLTLWIAFQLLFPLRHFAYEGNVHWNDQGHKFSWHMMLRSKDHLDPIFIIVEKGNEEAPIYVNPMRYLSAEQTFSMADRPEMVWQFARFLESKAQQEGMGEVAVYADIVASLNGRPYSRMVKLNEDLTRVPRPLGGNAASWLPRLTEPLADTRKLPRPDEQIFMLP